MSNMAMAAREIEKKYDIGVAKLDEIEEGAARGKLPGERLRGRKTSSRSSP